MDSLVVDASVALAWFEQGPQAEAALKIHDDIIRGVIAASAPDFLLVEAANILFWRKKLDRKHIRAVLEKVFALGISFDETPLTGEVLHLLPIMEEYRVSAYDAQYLYLAQKHHCKLVSFDKKLLRIKDWVIAPS